MSPEHLNIAVNGGLDEVTVRLIELQKENVLPVLEPIRVELAGILGAPCQYLEKRKNEIDIRRAHLLVNREKMTLTLIVNETDQRNIVKVEGSLSFNPKYVQFGINADKTWEPAQLSKFLKLNRSCFTDLSANMELVTILKNFSASIAQKVEKSREDNGSRAENFSQVVHSNLPKSFVVAMPIFKGRPTEQIEVEIVADVEGRNVLLSLCAPSAEVIVEEERNRAIDEQLGLILNLAPDLVIIEQ